MKCWFSEHMSDAGLLGPLWGSLKVTINYMVDTPEEP